MDEVQRRVDEIRHPQQRDGEPSHRHVPQGRHRPARVRPPRHGARHVGRHDRLPGERVRLGRRGRRRDDHRARTSSPSPCRRAARSPRRSTARRARSTRSRSPTTAASRCWPRRASTSSGRTPSSTRSRAWPRAGRRTSDASVWTFKIRQGVKFHDGKDMTSEDVAASINRLADPDNASAGALGLHRLPHQGQREGDRRDDGRVHARGAERVVPVPAELGQLQHDHPARRLRRRLREEHERHRPVHPREVHAGPGRDVPQEPRLLGQGAPAEPGQHGDPLLRQGAGPRARPAVGRGRRGHAVLRHRRPRAPDRPERADGRAEGLDAPPGPPAHGQGAVHGQARAPGAGALDRPQRARRRPLQGQGPARQRLAVRARVQVHGHVGRAAPAGHRAGQAAARRRGLPTASRSSWTPGTASRSPTSRS